MLSSFPNSGSLPNSDSLPNSHSLPNSDTAWYHSYDHFFEFLDGVKITLEDLQALREQRVSGSTLNHIEALLLRVTRPEDKDWVELPQALVEIGKISPDIWDTVEHIANQREPTSTTAKGDSHTSNIALHPKSRKSGPPARPMGPEEESSETPASPDEPGQQETIWEWVSGELPMSIWHNFRYVMEQIFYLKELPPSVDKTLDSKIGAYRTTLTNMDTVTSLFSATVTDIPSYENLGEGFNKVVDSFFQQSGHDRSPEDEQVKVIPEQGVMENGNQEQPQHHDSVDETLNVSFICDIVNVIVNRIRDYLDTTKGQPLDLRLVASPAFIAERRRYKVANIITAIVDAYMTIPKQTSPSANSPDQFVFIVEAKRSVKGNPKLPFQIAAQLMGWMRSREAEFKAIFAQGDVAEQHLLHLQYIGDQAMFFIASFKSPYLEYVSSAKQCTRSRLTKDLERQIQDQWQNELNGRKNEGNMPAGLLKGKSKERNKQNADQAEKNLEEKLAKLEKPPKKDTTHYKMMLAWEVIEVLQATVQADTKEPTQALPTDPRRGADPIGTDHFMCLQGYGPFNVLQFDELEELLKVFIALEITARKGRHN
ncbi:hypothetical protein EV127DRAFT_483755 [Xylaria flabelliformis]|nr:hypothetical protein EV127DRAFT_483755 [Xylaria flabelliformis]